MYPSVWLTEGLHKDLFTYSLGIVLGTRWEKLRLQDA